MPYVPKTDTVVTTLDELKQYVDDELLALAQEFEAPQRVVWYQPITGAPSTGSTPVIPRPREGMTAFLAPGVLSPGSQGGLYEFKAGAWSKI